MQSHLEIARLQAELRDDQTKIQQLESELSDLKLKQSNQDSHSIEVNLPRHGPFIVHLPSTRISVSYFN